MKGAFHHVAYSSVDEENHLTSSPSVHNSASATSPRVVIPLQKRPANHSALCVSKKLETEVLEELGVAK